MKSRTLMFVFLLFSGIVVGSLAGEMAAGVPALSWLNFGLRFGLDAPVSLSLGVIALSFGFSINLTVSCIIFVILSLFIGTKVFRG